MKTLIGALVMVLAVQSASLAQTPAASPQPMTSGAPQPMASGATVQGGGAVPLIPVGKKGPAGSAVLAQQGGNLVVTVHLPAGYQTTGKAAIYSGSCKSSGQSSMTGGKAYPLTVSTDSNAPSMTTLKGVTIDSLTSSPHVIVVMGTPALCGDVANLLPPQKP